MLFKEKNLKITIKSVKKQNKQAQRRAAAETVARKPIEHFIHDK